MPPRSSRRLSVQDLRWASPLLRFCGALWGLSIAIAALPLWNTPAPATQLPAFLTMLGINGHAPARAFLTLILFPVFGALTSVPLMRFVERGFLLRWAILSLATAMAGTGWIALVAGSPALTILVPIVVAAVVLPLGTRPARFSLRDVILIPTTVALFFALLDLVPAAGPAIDFVLAVLFIFILRILLVVAPGTLPPAMSFALAPVVFVAQSNLVSRSFRHSGWLPLIWIVATPLLLRLLIRSSAATERKMRRWIAFGLFPLIAYLYPLAQSLSGAEGLARVDLFEMGHGLLPASEMLRGEKPYLDVVPGHGLIEDGLLDYFALRWKGQTLGDVLELRGMVAPLTGCAIYAIGFAVTSSPEAGLLTFLFSASTFGTTWVRVAVSLLAVGFMISAGRMRRPRHLGVAGALTVLAGMVSVDFGVYAVGALLVAVTRQRGARRRALLYALAGGIVAALPFAIWFAAGGMILAFLRVTFFDIPAVSPVYALGFSSFPETFTYVKAFPDVLALAFDRSASPFILWVLIVLITAALLVRKPSPRRVAEGLVPVGVWIALSGISWAERHHFYFQFAFGAFLVPAVWILWRSRDRAIRSLAAVATLALMVLAQPTAHLSRAAAVRTARGPLETQWSTWWELPRARHALFRSEDIGHLQTLRRHVERSLNPSQTFFDFANLPILHYLFDRPVPIRQYEVPFYETEALQREVIDRLEADRSVELAIISFPSPANVIDGVPNSERAPLVWKYLQEHFRPDFEEDGIEVWKRKTEGP